MEQLDQFFENQNNKNQLDSVREESIVIPIIKEDVVINKQVVEKGKVIISKKIREENFNTVVPVFSEEVIIERIQKDTFIDGVTPLIRVEGDKTIIPILKEVYVKRLLLVEELHITKQKTMNNISINETLKRNEVVVERPDKPLS